jgi:hypothetical protein
VHAYLPEDDEEGRDKLGDLVVKGGDKDAENALAQEVQKLKSATPRPGRGLSELFKSDAYGTSPERIDASR